MSSRVKQAQLIWDKALQNSGELNITFNTIKEASQFRTLMYRVRAQKRKRFAEVQGVLPDDVNLEWDAMQVTIADDSKTLEIRNSGAFSFVVADPTTGEAL